MDFDIRRANVRCRFNLCFIRIDKQGDQDAGIRHTEEMLTIACETKPHFCCLVPEKRQEVTTEGGLDVLPGASPAPGSRNAVWFRRRSSASLR
jgi:hypothetical protein